MIAPVARLRVAAVRVAAVLIAAVLATGCGARSGLRGAPRRGEDAGVHAPMDAGRLGDAGAVDAGRDTGPEPCPACDDGVFCNGAEGCAADGTCIAGFAPDCDDGDECTVDACDRAADACENVPMERDDDGDGVSACAGDCDDLDPTVAPGLPEVCDDRDQDCDARIDEGVRSECDDCRLGCRRVVVPDETTERWDLIGSEHAGVAVDDDGDLVLGTARTEAWFAWIANYLFASVTRLDTRDGRQAAEYDSVLLDGTNHAAPTGEECETERRGGNCPSRTAVDLRGAVYVANRAFFSQGTVTKIAGFESDCIDRNGNGTIDTSRDVDGDGVIERTVPGEFLGQLDECLLWTVDVGGIDGVPRAIALDASGTVWVGLHNESRAVQLDPSDGHVLQTVDFPRRGFGPFRPYGAAADGRGQVWFTEAATGVIMAIDTESGEVVMRDTALSRSEDCGGSYGIAIDGHDRVWLAGFLCPVVFRFDQDARTWREIVLEESGITRGIAADADDRIYVASSHDWLRFLPGGRVEASPPVSRLTTFDGNTMDDVRIFGTDDAPLPGAAATGVGLDSEGMAWLVNQESSTATRIDPRTGEAREFATGMAPYTYSDFTGYALRTFTTPNGYLRTIVAGCGAGPTEWELVMWSATTPPGTRIELRARTADRIADLRSATWVGPFVDRPTDLFSPPGPIGNGRHVELEIELFGGGGTSSPRVDDLVVQYHCP
jgi:hypothetical protein